MRRFLSVFILAMFSLVGFAQQYEMVFTDYDYGTLYLDFAVDIPDEVRGVYYIYAIEGNDAKRRRIWDVIPARTAVMVQGNHNKTYIFKKTDADVSVITDNLLRGSLVNISVADALAEAGASDKAVVMTYGKPKDIVGYMGFYHYTGKTLKANKAFLIYDPEEGSDVNSLTISVEEDDLDYINNVDESKGNETWHTLQGICLNVAPTHPGIYIRNGKTVVIK